MISKLLAKILVKENKFYFPFSIHDSNTLKDVVMPGDVLLVEGNRWISNSVKYLTQSTWSHVAFYAGNVIEPHTNSDDPNVVIEAEIDQGVVAVPLSKYTKFNVRICRPIGLSDTDREKVIGYMLNHIGDEYDLDNIIDLARYFFPVPFIPIKYRRRFLSLGSGDPTKAICSSLIARAFQSVKYPILPRKIEMSKSDRKTFYYVRHHSLFTPRDFDLSPYFDVVKPTLKTGFKYRDIHWKE